MTLSSGVSSSWTDRWWNLFSCHRRAFFLFRACLTARLSCRASTESAPTLSDTACFAREKEMAAREKKPLSRGGTALLAFGEPVACPRRNDFFLRVWCSVGAGLPVVKLRLFSNFLSLFFSCAADFCFSSALRSFLGDRGMSRPLSGSTSCAVVAPPSSESYSSEQSGSFC